jgi:SH3 domain-containing YSC84-like protein 1
MTRKITRNLILKTLFILASSITLLRAADMPERIQDAIQILDKKQHSNEPIPERLIKNAKGIAIFNITKGGLGIGGLGGDGIIVLRLNNALGHSWTAPSAFSLGGATIGAQIGFTEDKYIVLLNTNDAVKQFTSSGKMNWNATATGTVGADSATERVSTSELEKREVIIYKNSGGVFGGATLGGTQVECKDSVNQKAYGDDVSMENILNGKVYAPKSADRLFMLLDGKL